MQPYNQTQVSDRKMALKTSQRQWTHVEDTIVKSLLHPAIDSQFKAIATAPDHNCLWNAICLCLGLPEYRQIEFRNVTRSTILENEEHFRSILVDNMMGETFETVLDACLQSNQSAGWGNEYHVLALAIALNRNIYVYSTFMNDTTGRFFQNARIDISKLVTLFEDKCAQTSQHRNYQPVKDINCRSPLCLFYDKSHYTALVPRVSNPVYCIPHQVIVQSIDSDDTHDSKRLHDKTPSGISDEIMIDKTLNSKVSNKPVKKKKHAIMKTAGENNDARSDWSEWYRKLSEDEKKAYNQRKAKNKNARKKSPQNTAPNGHSKTVQSAWLKWYNKLSTDEKRDYNQKKAKNKNAKKKSVKTHKTTEPNALDIMKENKNIQSAWSKWYSKLNADEKKAYNQKKAKSSIARQKPAQKTTRKTTNPSSPKSAGESKPVQSAWVKWYNKLSPSEKRDYNRRKAKNRKGLPNEKKAYNQKKAKSSIARQKPAQKTTHKTTNPSSSKSADESKPVQSAWVKWYNKLSPSEKRDYNRRKAKNRKGLPNIKDNRNVQSTWSKWYSKLSQDEKKAYNKSKAKNKKSEDRSMENKTYYQKHGEESKTKGRKRKTELYEDPVTKEKLKEESRKRLKLVRGEQKEKRKDFNYLLQQANMTMQEFPALACTVCHRARYKEQVLPCRRNKYNNTVDIQKAMTGDYIHKCDSSCTDSSKYHKLKKKEWICFTCDRHLRKGNVPPQAIVNGLRLDPIPEELKALNPLEKHLISIIQAFQKIVPLPRGGQKGVRGQMVCVPADLQKTADTLPWTLDTNNLIRVKLKRKLKYKGHHLYMTVSQEKIMKAIMKLKDINTLYKDITINDNWVTEMIEKGYTQLVDELYVPTEEEQYEVYLESQKDIELLFGEYSKDEDVLYDVFFESKIEEGVEYLDGKYGKEMLVNRRIHKELEKELENDIIMFNTEDKTLSMYIDADEMAEHEEYIEDPDLRKEYNHYIAGIEADNSNTMNEEIEPNIHPLDRDTEHPFQISSLQQIDPSAVMSDGDVMSVAPSEGKRPVNALQSEAMCYPVIYPTGKNAFLTQTELGIYKQDRPRDISITKYFDSRVLSIDNRLQGDSEWIFYAQFLKEVEQVRNAATIAMKKGPGITTQGQKLTVGDLIDDNKLNKSVIRTNLGYRYLSDVPATPAYWEKTMNGLFAGFKQIGPPSFFISFSAADRRWPEIAQAMLAQQGKDPGIWDTLTWSEYCELVNRNPVTAVLMFERRVTQFVKIMTSDCQPLGGKVNDMFLRREMQDRGWPHIHAMVWVEGAPSPDVSDPEHIKFAEQAISCALPDENEDPVLYEIVTSVQRHSRTHSKTCFKNRTSDCRFDYPKPIATCTYVLRPTEPPAGITIKEWQKSATEIVSRVKNFLTETQDLQRFTVENVLSACDTNEEEYKAALGALCKREQIVLRRNPIESWINFYNKDLLKFWSGNMDIQYIYNPYACAKYCLSYIAKAEREMGDLMRKAQHEARQGNMEAIAELRHLGDIYLTHRSVSVMEAVYRLTQLPLKTFTRDVVFIPVDDASYRFSLPLKVLQQKNKASSQIWTANIVDRYLARPNQAVFINMTLAEFAADYQRHAVSNTDDNDTKKENVYKLVGDMGYIHKRGKRAIIRYFKANVTREPERYYKNLIRLYFPHRKLEILPPYQSYEEMFFRSKTLNAEHNVVSICDIVQDNLSKFEKNAVMMEDCWEECRNSTGDDQFAWADLAPSTEEDRLNQVDEREEMEQLDEDYIEDEPVSQSFPNEIDTTQQAYTIASTPMVATNELNEMIRKMNDQQYPFLMHIREWCLKTIRGEKPDPFYIHLTGSAGTGKSHLVRSIYQLATRILQQAPSNSDLDSGEVVLLTSYTGSAAFNIGGSTIHSLFSIPLNPPKEYKPIKPPGLHEIERKLSKIKLLIIDEISFVDKNLLGWIHGRLKQVKKLLNSPHAPFGNTSVLAVGDFFQLAPIAKQMVCKKSPNTEYLWGIFVLYQLDEIIRQKGDTSFAEMLNRKRVRVRHGKKLTPLQEKDEKLLQSREIAYNPESSDYPHGVYHLFSRWEEVDDHNAVMLEQVCSEKRNIMAVDKKYQGGKVYVLESPQATETPFQPRELNIGVGARAMLKMNLDVQDGLANSQIGTVVYIHDGKLPNGQPECIYIKFDDERVGQKLRRQHVFPAGVPKDSVPIMPLSYELSRGSGSKVVRFQYPLVLAWAGTIHSSQGRTLQEVVVSFHKMFAKGQAYVALSRVTSSAGLYLLDVNSSKIYCDESIIDCYASMPKLDINHNVLPDCRMLTIVHHNVEGLRGHRDDLLRCKQLFPCDFLCVTESHCQEMQNQNDLMPGYMYSGRSRKECYNIGKEHFLNDLKKAAKGGVGIFIANHIQSTCDTQAVDFWFEDITIEHIGISLLDPNNGTFNIICMYRPPKLPMHHFCAEARKLLLRITPGSATIIVGDFNEDGRKTGLPIQTMFATNGYKQLISKPTTSDKNGAILDHIYISENIAYIFSEKLNSGVIPTHFSFHEATYVTF